MAKPRADNDDVSRQIAATLTAALLQRMPQAPIPGRDTEPTPAAAVALYHQTLNLLLARTDG